ESIEAAGMEGEPLSLDMRGLDPKYSEYFECVRRMIKEKWDYPCVKHWLSGKCDYKDTRLVIDFGILKDGRVPYVIVRRPSQFSVYNEYAIRAIRAAAPFPSIPDHLQDQRPGLPIRAAFRYQIVFEKPYGSYGYF